MMSRPILIALTNSVSPERDDEYNHWYNEVHAKDLLSLPTMRSMTRYRALQQITPGGSQPHHKYLAIYDLDDPVAAYEALVERRSTFTMTDAIADPSLISYVPFFTKANG
jgi:hypothetical protein